MKQHGLSAILIVFILLGFPACTPAPLETAAAETAAVQPQAADAAETAQPAEPADAEAVVLTLTDGDQQLEYTLEELKALPAASGQAGMVSSTGKITVPAKYTGVLLSDLLDLLGGITPDLGVNIVAEDGYAMTLSYDQVMQNDFITYDPSDGTELDFDEPLQVMVAYAVNDQPLDAKSDGTLRMVIISETNNQITDGHWSVKWVNRIEVQPVSREWNLSLTGSLAEVIDRNTFQSCAASSCHQVTWTDDEGQVWAGVPLYLLAGRVDDDLKHDGPAYNRELANAGYQIELVAADGYTTALSGSNVYYERQILVAYLVNDAQLPDKYFPLRLVGEDTEKGQRIGAITEIRLLMDEVNDLLSAEETAQPTQAKAEETAAPGKAVVPEGTALAITGRVTNPLNLSADALESLPMVELTLEHPKKGAQQYTGIYLNSLLGLAMPEDGASTLVLTAFDGYTASLDLAAVRACADCLLMLSGEESGYDLAMPGFETSAWIKGMVSIEIR